VSLASALGMERTAGITPAVAFSPTRHQAGLLWREGIEVVPDSLMRYDSHVLGNSYGLVAAVFDLGGKKVRVGSAHLSHCDPGLSADGRMPG